MRKIKCFYSLGMTVEEVLDEFNERASEHGIQEKDVISVSALPPVSGLKLGTPTGTAAPRVEVAITYWAKE